MAKGWWATHKNYKYLADADKKNEFDVERYMKRHPAVVKPEEPFEMYELKIEPDSDNEVYRMN